MTAIAGVEDGNGTSDHELVTAAEVIGKKKGVQ
jgi:hypothetical protein